MAAEVSGSFQSRAVILKFALLAGMTGRGSGCFETTIGMDTGDRPGNALLLAASIMRIANFGTCPSIVIIRSIEFAVEGSEGQ